MKHIHSIKLSVFSKEEEDYEKIKKAFLSLVPLDLEKEKLKLKESTAIGFAEKKIKILELDLVKEKYTNVFLNNLLEHLNEDKKELLIKQKESRLDDELCFFIRLDKPKLLNGEYWITDEGNCFHIKMHVAAYPAKKEKALELIEGIIR